MSEGVVCGGSGGRGGVLKARKGKEMDSASEPPNRNAAPQHLDFNPMRLCQTLTHKNVKQQTCNIYVYKFVLACYRNNMKPKHVYVFF